MKLHLLKTSCLIVPAALALALLASARADDNNTTIKFSDPSKPGTMKISLGRGELTVQGTDTNEVSVKSDVKASTSKPRKDGLRVISSSASFALGEKENVITLDAANEWGGKGAGDFKITVPRNTSVIVQNAWGGDIKCSGVAGDIEINSMHGEVRLDDVSGGVVVSTMNGEIRANVRELRDGKPLSFTSMNGEVLVRVPESAKANVRLRTQNGSVLTDFDETSLATKTEASPVKGRVMSIRNTKGLSMEIQDAIRDATQVSATAVREALEAVKEGFEASKLDMDETRKQLDEARKEIERARAESDRARRDGEREQRRAATVARAGRTDEGKPTPAPAAPPAPAAWPMVNVKVPMPTISGGKLVTGTLNGGGPEISVATMNGDVILRKLEAGK